MDQSNLLAAVDAFLAHLAHDRGYASTTVSSYRGDLIAACAHFAAAGLPCDLRDVTREAIREFLRTPTPSGAPRAPRTRNRRLAALRACFTWAKAEGLIDQDPTAGVPWSKVAPRDPPTFGEGDISRIVQAARRHRSGWQAARDEALLVLFAQTGLRLAEIVGLDMPQVQLDEARLLRVRRKGGARRDLVVNSEVVRVLRAWLRERLASAPPDEPALFLSRERRRISRRMVQMLVAKYATVAGIEGTVTPHLFRHAACYILQKRGAPMPVAQALLGHSRITTTALYSRATEQDQRAAVAALEDLTRP